MHTLARVPAREFGADREPAGPVGVRRALTWPLRLALGLLLSVALWAFLSTAARAADDVAPTSQPPDATSTTDPEPTEPPPDGDPAVDPVTEPVDETTPPPAEETAPPPAEETTPPPADDGTQPPPEDPPTDEQPPPVDVAPPGDASSDEPGTTDPNGVGGVDCPAPAGGDSSACPTPEQPPVAQPEDSPVTDEPAQQPDPQEPAGQDPSVPPEVVVDQPQPVEQPADEPETEVVPEVVPEVVVSEVVDEVALEAEAVPPPADVCAPSDETLVITSIGDLASPAVACGDVLPTVELPLVTDPAVDIPVVALAAVPVWSPDPTVASSETAPVAADEPTTPTLSATVPGHQPYPTHRPVPGAPAPVPPAAPPAPAATASGNGCGGTGLRRDVADRVGDQVAVLTDPADLGVPTAVEQACTNSPADAVLAREADPRLRPD